MTLSSWENLAVCAPFVALLIVAAVTDVRARRIPNWLTLTVTLAGLAQTLTPWRVVTPLYSIYGCLTGFIVTILLYSIGARGAGDVKLTAGIGAWVGPAAVIVVLAAAALVSLVAALGQSAARGRLLDLFRNSGLMLVNLVNVRRLGREHVMATGAGCKSIDRPLPNAVSMLLATVGVVMWVNG
ncbi:MAG: A24 family peptidase [Tepidisphaeraceae bacterium]